MDSKKYTLTKTQERTIQMQTISNSEKALRKTLHPDNAVSEGGSRKFIVDQASTTLRAPRMLKKNQSQPLVVHIDDDVDLVDALSARLKSVGYDVASALDGASGFRSVLQRPASLIILDYDMPNGKGDTVIEMLKDNERTKDIPIVVLTAMNQPTLKRAMLAKGADRFMTKPFEFNEIHETIGSLLGGQAS